MADHEVSKIMWIGIVVALSTSIFVIAKPGVQSQTGSVFDKIENVVSSINVLPEREGVPDESDAKWTVKANYGINGRFVMDKDGNAVVYAIDASKPITVDKILSGLTGNNPNMTTLKYVDNVVATHSLQSFFSLDKKLKSIDGLNKFDTSRVTHMGAMFYDTALESIDISSFDMTNVKVVDSIFAVTPNLNSIDITPFKDSKLTSFNAVFYKSGIKEIKGLTLLNTSNIVSSSATFASTPNLTSLDISNWNMSNNKDISTMFMGARSLSRTTIKANNFTPTTGTNVKTDSFDYGVDANLASYLNALFLPGS
ncbi:BspA family leucine-rich repeat surface protein [Anaerotruncus sp. X29]|nr:BspA family leucine-rich repeat surface protein [Anaerotruncus sp. X29]